MIEVTIDKLIVLNSVDTKIPFQIRSFKKASIIQLTRITETDLPAFITGKRIVKAETSLCRFAISRNAV